MMALVVLTATMLSLFVSSNIESIIVPTALDRLDTVARRRTEDLKSFVKDVGSQVLGDRQTSPIQGIVRATEGGGFDKQDNSTLEQWRRRLAVNFDAAVKGRHLFFKYRFIGIANGGREIVRVDRMTPNASVRIVPESLLQAKGDRDFFQNTLALKDGEVYSSPIELNQDYGRIAIPYVPVLRISTPVRTDRGEPFGIIVANIDMRIVLDDIRKRAPVGIDTYIVDESGNYLLNPDPSLEFGSELKRKTDWRRDFPEVATVFASSTGYARTKANSPQGPRYVVASVVDLGSGRRIAVIETTLEATVLATSAEVRRSSLLAGLGAAMVAVLLAVFVARSLSKPIERLNKSVESFDGQNAIDAPVGAAGEVGTLAQSFKRMADDIRARTEELRATDEKLRLYGAVVESSADAILTVTLDGVITAWNPAAEKLFGYSEEEAIGNTTHLITPPARLEESESYLALVHEGERVEHFETVRIDKSGRMIDVALTISPVYDADGNVFCVSKIVRDMTDFNRISAHLRQSQKMEAIGTLAGGIAHDFNNIIAAILGNVAMTRDDLPKDHPAQDTLDEIQKAATRATGIVRQILKFSRADEGKQEAVRIGPIVEEAVQFLRRTAPSNIEFEVSVEAGLPFVSASGTELHQVLMNLGVNAFHAMSESGGILAIRAGLFVLDEMGADAYPDLVPGTYVRLDVSDTGSGMEAATLERAFEPFFSTKASGEGTGLGLSMVYGIIKAHKGMVTVYSGVGKGTVFHIYLPIAESDAVAEVKTNGNGSHGHGETILYVDDDEALVTMTKRMLGKLNYNVVGFDSPLDALQAFAANPYGFDVVVTDLSMPKMDGPEFVTKIKEIRPETPVIMLTGYIRPEDTERTTHLGIRRLMLKPNTVQEMSVALREIVDEIRSERQKESES